MPHINAQTLRHFIKTPMTQAKLVEKSKVSKATIARILGGKVAKQNEETTKRIAEALGVTPDQLCAPIDRDAALKAQLEESGMRMLRIILDKNSWWNFDVVVQRYGISIKDQLHFAPMAIMLLAEASLAERKQKLDAREKAIGQLRESALSYNDLNLGESQLDNEYWRDKASIQRRDLFGEWYWADHIKHELDEPFDRYATNPFADFLKRKQSEVAPDLRLDDLSDSGLWNYSICEDEFYRITGDDARAEMALNRCYVRLVDIPSDLLDDSKTQDRIAWLKTKLPDEVWKEHEAFWASLDSIVPSL